MKGRGGGRSQFGCDAVDVGGWGGLAKSIDLSWDPVNTTDQRQGINRNYVKQ